MGLSKVEDSLAITISCTKTVVAMKVVSTTIVSNVSIEVSTQKHNIIYRTTRDIVLKLLTELFFFIRGTASLQSMAENMCNCQSAVSMTVDIRHSEYWQTSVAWSQSLALTVTATPFWLVIPQISLYPSPMSWDFWPFHWVSWIHVMSTLHLISMSADSHPQPVMVPMFSIAIWIFWIWVWFWANFFDQYCPWISRPCQFLTLVRWGLHTCLQWIP